MRLDSIGMSDSQPSDKADETRAATDRPARLAGPSPTPCNEVTSQLDSMLSTCAHRLSGGIKQAANRRQNADAETPVTQPHTFGDQVEGFVQGAVEATGKMASGLWSVAKGAAALSPLSYAAETVSDKTGLNLYHGFSQTAASARQVVGAVASNPGGVLKAAVEPYRSAWRAGDYGKALGMGTVDAVSLFAGGVGEAGKAGEAASAAEKLAEAANVAGKVDKVAVAGALEAGAPAEAEASVGAAASRTAESATPVKPAAVESNEARAPGAKAAAATRPANTTRHGVPRTNPSDWRSLRDHWDQLGYGEILSKSNRSAIARGRTPKVDDAWISVFPEDAGLKGERISMHHIGGSPVTVPLPATRHLDAHMPGGFRHNPGGPGSALPSYPPKSSGN